MSTYKIDIPRLIATDDRIKDREQLTHASSNRNFLELASRDQALMKAANGRVVSDRGQSGHIENTTNIRTAGLDMTPAAIKSSISIEGSNADQSGNLMPVEPTQLGQARQHRVGCCGADAFAAAKQVIPLPPGRTGTDLIIEIVFQLRDVLFQPLNVFLNEGPHRRRRTLKSILLGDQHPDQ